MQIVSYAGKFSTSLPITAGVPQGSILGPLLFILYVNEFPKYFPDMLAIQYADDTTLLDQHVNRNCLKEKTTANLQRLRTWFADNNLSLNLDKTQNIMFSPREEQQHIVKFLGVYVDGCLSWKFHIRDLTSKLSSILFLLRRLTEFAPMNSLKAAYYGLFQSKLSYALIFWGNSTEWFRVFRMQKTAVRILLRKKSTDSCRPLFKKLQIVTLPGLYILQCITFIKTNILEYVTINSRHNYDTRHGNNLLRPQHRLTLTQRSYINVAIELFNSIPESYKNLPLSVFKKKTKRMLLEICPYNIEEFLTNVQHFN